MAAPTLQAEGAVAAVTSGNLTITLPAHQTDDILIVVWEMWAPNTAGSLGGPGAPSGWTIQSGTDVTFGASAPTTVDGRVAIYWRRATSGSETNPVFSPPTGADTGNDMCHAGRAYVIRGCVTTGDPWDAAVRSGDPGYTAANGAFPAVTVSGSERLVVQFLGSLDNQSAGAAPSGWTAGTAATTATGTDAGFQTFRKDNVSSSTAADSSATAAPAQGGYCFIGVSFKPPAGVALTKDLADTITLSDSVVKTTGLRPADTVTLSDSATRAAGLGKADTITLSDSISRAWAAVKSFSDTITLTDAAGKAVTLPLADAITLSDAASVTRGLALSLTDTITLSDSATKGAGLGKADSITLSDAVSRVWAISRSFADVVALSDSVAKSLARTLADQVSLTDALTKSMGMSLSDAFALSESIGRGVGKGVGDTVTLSDAIDKVLTPGGGPSLSFNDTLALTDDIILALNGKFIHPKGPLATILLNRFDVY